MEDVIKKLNQPLPEHHVSQREGFNGVKLDYLEAWFVIKQANEIFGCNGWECKTIRLVHIGSESYIDKHNKEKHRVAYRATAEVTALIGNEFVTRQGSGFGNGIDAVEQNAHELALKEAESDALKRAFKSFGDQFGLHLYDKDRSKIDPLGAAGYKSAAARNEAAEMLEFIMDNWSPHMGDLEQVKKWARRPAKTEPMLTEQWKERFKSLEQLEKDMEKDAEKNSSY